MNVFIANIGNQDVAFNLGTSERPDFVAFKKWDRAGEISEMLGCAPGTRACISALAQEYPDRQELLQLLRFPILQPALKQASRHCAERDETIDRVVLAATDQDREEAPDHYPWDTIEAARLIKELLPLLANLEPLLDSASIEVLSIEIHPQRFENAYQHLDGTFNKPAEPDKHVYASVNGGIPALNSALRIHVLNLFGPHAHLIETDDPSKEGKRRGVEGRSRIANSWPYRRDALLRMALLHKNKFSQRSPSSMIFSSNNYRIGLRHAQLRHPVQDLATQARLRTLTTKLTRP